MEKGGRKDREIGRRNEEEDWGGEWRRGIIFNTPVIVLLFSLTFFLTSPIQLFANTDIFHTKSFAHPFINVIVNVQVSFEYKIHSQIIEPPPTAQTEHARDLKFCMVAPQGTRLRVIEPRYKRKNDNF